MKWKKFTIHTTSGAEDFISMMLADCGIEGIEIDDKVPLTESDKARMFVDEVPSKGPDDGKAEISFYLDDTYDVPSTLARVREGLREVSGMVEAGSCDIDESETEDKDWINNWKKYFQPFAVGDLLIVPTWEKIPENTEGKTVIRMDPGLAFGTGKHETTQLVMRGIRKYVKPGDEVLDVGTGSGILGICSLLVGAKHVLGTDLDDLALDAARDNMKANGISPDRFDIVIGNLIDDPAVKKKAGWDRYDVVCANILANVIIPLQKVIAPHMKMGGVFISSGIINTAEDEVRAAMEANPALEIIETVHQGDWVSLVCRRVR
ncbi:MAG: 50S ribosomal protein L11 methyltransferase [Lachnospiraceae bacterium]|jgi:ribosomal protein L11 methyltransferase